MGHLREAYAYHFSHAELPTRGFPFKQCLRGCLRGSCCKNNLKMMVLKTRNETCHRRGAMQFLDAFFPTCQVSEGCCLSSFFCSSSPRPPRQSSSPSVSPILFAKLLANPLRQLRIAVCTAGPLDLNRPGPIAACTAGPQPPKRMPKYMPDRMPDRGLACKGPGWLTFITMMSLYDPYHGLPWCGFLEVK